MAFDPPVVFPGRRAIPIGVFEGWIAHAGTDFGDRGDTPGLSSCRDSLSQAGKRPRQGGGGGGEQAGVFMGTPMAKSWNLCALAATRTRGVRVRMGREAAVMVQEGQNKPPRGEEPGHAKRHGCKVVPQRRVPGQQLPDR